MEMIPVSSTNISAIGYDADAELLAVQFADGLYHYYGVPQFIFDQFDMAESKGKFHHVYIKNQYPYDKVG